MRIFYKCTLNKNRFEIFTIKKEWDKLKFCFINTDKAKIKRFKELKIPAIYKIDNTEMK